MALLDNSLYCNAGDQSTTGYYALTKWAANTPYTVGNIRRPKTAPAVGSERAYVCIVAGTSANPTEPTWTFTRGVKVTDGATVIWQECTGLSGVNGDATNTPTWATLTGTAAFAVTLGQLIRRNNGASYWICSTAGTTGASEPAWANDTAGTTRSDGTATWTCLGVVGNFAAWGAPFARLASATTATWYLAGTSTVYVASAHAESQTTAITIAPTAAPPLFGKILCVNAAGSMPPVAADLTTGATISTTAAAVLINWNGGDVYVYGLTFISGSGVSTSSNSMAILPVAGTRAFFDACSFQFANSTASNVSQLSMLSNSAAAAVTWNNCTVKFSTTFQFISPGTGNFRWQNTGTILVSGSSVPTTLFKFGGNVTGTGPVMVLEALDLSQLTGALNTYNTVAHVAILNVIDCKLNASMSITQPGSPAQTVQFVRSDSTATAFKSSRYQYEGTETTETTITRVGGAVDPAGNTQSRKIVTVAANVQFVDPFAAEVLGIWNNTTVANVTATIYGTINSASLPNNDELWAECEYLGTASFPTGNLITSAKATVLTASGATGANANISTDTSTWNGGGSGAGWTPFKIVFQLDTTHNPQPQFAGFLTIRVKAAKANTTYYIDPQVVLS